jgi:GR25 family glycosyltransferase involved in LPS biosynthesis
MAFSTNLLICICIFILFILHFYFEYGYLKKFQEHFDSSRDAFFNKIDRIYYINLQHRQDRKDEFLNNFSPKDEAKIRRIDAVHTNEYGAIGCFKSHIKALEMALADSKNPNDIVLICEDDFYIKDIFYCNRMLDWAFDALPDWDVIMLAHNTHTSNGTPYSTRNNEKIIQVTHSATASGYLMKSSYVPKLLEIYKRDDAEYEKTKEFKREYINDVSWIELQKKDKWFAFVPTIATQRRSYSDIQKGVVDYGL